MVVALGAGHRRTHPDRPGGVHAIDDGHIAELLAIGAALGVGLRIAVKGRRHNLFLGGVRQQVAGNLLDREAIEGLVGVDRTDHVIAKGPDLARLVLGVTGRIRITGRIEPGPGPMLAITGLGHLFVDQAIVRVRPGVRHKAFDFLQSRRQPRRVEGHAANERRSVGRRGRLKPFLLQSRQDEVVDRVPRPIAVANLRQRRPHRSDTGPVLSIDGPLFDPAAERLDVDRREPLAGGSRRHPLVGVRRLDAP